VDRCGRPVGTIVESARPRLPLNRERLGGAAVADHAADPCRRRTAVRRPCRGRGRKSGDDHGNGGVLGPEAFNQGIEIRKLAVVESSTFMRERQKAGHGAAGRSRRPASKAGSRDTSRKAVARLECSLQPDMGEGPFNRHAPGCPDLSRVAACPDEPPRRQINPQCVAQRVDANRSRRTDQRRAGAGPAGEDARRGA
jgi:hypothetical protein